MSDKNSKPSKEKTSLHPKNKHRGRYNFDELTKSYPALKPFVRPNDYGDLSIDFFNPEAVKNLNAALLKHFYHINRWDVPKGYLCPPIPGRADYIHHIAELYETVSLKLPKWFNNDHVNCLDIGVGANCIYPIIGTHEYDWNFVGSEIDVVAIQSAQEIIDNNNQLREKVELRHQSSGKNIFKGLIKPKEEFHIVVCNPPFHSSAEEARAGSTRKLRNLKKERNPKAVLNFGGQSNELWCKGGEAEFIRNMITQSKDYSNSVVWFTTLVSKQTTLKNTYRELKKAGARTVKTISMTQGNKTSRIVAWSYFWENGANNESERYNSK